MSGNGSGGGDGDGGDGDGGDGTGKGEVGFFGTRAKGKSFVFIVDCSGSMTTPTTIPQPRQPFTTRFLRARQELLDLTASYNAALTDGWTDGNADNNLTALPRGLQTFAGVEFDVRGLVQLRCSKSFTEPFPKEIKKIPVGHECRKLHFLHAASTSWGTSTAVGSSRIRISA